MITEVRMWRDSFGKLHDTDAKARAAEARYEIEKCAMELIRAMRDDDVYLSDGCEEDIVKWLIGRGAENVITFSNNLQNYLRDPNP